jgi:hypothetical protein
MPRGRPATAVLVTSERSSFGPQTEQEYYAPGVGEIAERSSTGHREEFDLVSVTMLRSNRRLTRCRSPALDRAEAAS